MSVRAHKGKEVHIRLLGDPQPQSKEPDFVKEAYKGLEVLAEYQPPGVIPKYASGVYLVAYSDLLAAMAAKDERVYRTLSALLDRTRESERIIAMLPCRPGYCEEIRAVN